MNNLKYLFVGIIFGIVFVKAEIISWFRIQEMFRLHAFHMYGIIGTAILVGAFSVWLIKKLRLHSLDGQRIQIAPKEFSKGQIWGGLLFGFGWVLTGACPGPLYAQIGSGFAVIIITLFSAILGTWTYGRFRHLLPH